MPPLSSVYEGHYPIKRKCDWGCDDLSLHWILSRTAPLVCGCHCPVRSQICSLVVGVETFISFPELCLWSDWNIPTGRVVTEFSSSGVVHLWVYSSYVTFYPLGWLRNYTAIGRTLSPTLTMVSSVSQLSLSVISDSLRPHESQHARPPCPSTTPGVHSNSCPSGWWCHPAISSSVIPFSSCPQSLQASESFPMSQLFAWGGQSTGVSALASFLPENTQGWSPLGWLVGSPCSPRDSQESSPTPQFKSINSSVLSLLHSPILTSIHDHWKNHSLD